MPQREMMSEKKWFVLVDEKVLGPFHAAEVLKQIEQGQWSGCRFWAKGKPHWMIISQFQTELDREKQNAIEMKQPEPIWFVKDSIYEHSALTFNQLIEFLKSKQNYKNIHVAKDNKDRWQEVYHVDILMEKLGVNRRSFSRVPIEGTIAFQDGALRGKKVALTTISQGGLGASDVHGLSIGEKFRGTLTSPFLSVPIHFHAEVVFVSAEGSVGIKFINLSTEAITHIIAYVKQFVQAHPDTDYRKIA
jgi:hypothetical protein